MADYLNIAGRVRTTASDGVAMEAQEVKDLNLNKSQQEVNADVQTELGDRYTKEETYSKEQLDDLITTPDVNHVSVVATNATTAVTEILPVTGEANTIYRVGNWDGTQYDPTMYALFAWNGTTYVCLAVRSFVGEVYDVSVNHPDGQGNPTPYADLSAALGTGGANIPADIRRGGMSIKFIQGTAPSSDHKYVQYFLTKNEWSANEADWQKINLEEEVGQLGRKLIKLARWGSAGEPTDLQVGDVYTPQGTELRKINSISPQGVPSTSIVPFEDGAIYTIDNELYVYNGNILVKDNRVVLLTNMSNKNASEITATGQYYFNTSNNTLYKCYKFNTTISDSLFISEPLYTNTLYLCKGALYYFNGTNLSPFIPSEINSIIDTTVDISGIIETNNWYTGQVIGETIVQTTYNGAKAAKISVAQGEVYKLTAKGSGGGRGWYLLDSEDKIVQLAERNFDATIILTIPNGVSYLLIQSNSSSVTLALSIPGDFSKMQVDVSGLDSRVTGIENSIAAIVENYEFKQQSVNFLPMLAKLMAGENVFVNLAFIGDSWTQGIPTSGIQITYARNLAKKLQTKYGFGGLGWIDFARDHGKTDMFGACDGYEHFTQTPSGTFTNIDGSYDSGANCLGICCAHTVWSNGASLTLTFDAGKLDKFKIRYYKDAHFTIAINGGSATEITANSSDNWQETELGTTGTDITSVVITSLADDTVIYGMDCFYGTKGIRCHKVGNRSIKASDYLLMDATQWQTGFALLEPCWCSVMLAINDIGTSGGSSAYPTIINNISNLIGRVKTAMTTADGIITDVAVLGIAAISNTNYNGLDGLEVKERELALLNEYAFSTTRKVIGDDKALLTKYALFLDTIHLNDAGSNMLAEHIMNTLLTP